MKKLHHRDALVNFQDREERLMTSRPHTRKLVYQGFSIIYRERDERASKYLHSTEKIFENIERCS